MTSELAKIVVEGDPAQTQRLLYDLIGTALVQGNEELADKAVLIADALRSGIENEIDALYRLVALARDGEERDRALRRLREYQAFEAQQLEGELLDARHLKPGELDDVLKKAREALGEDPAGRDPAR